MRAENWARKARRQALATPFKDGTAGKAKQMQAWLYGSLCQKPIVVRIGGAERLTAPAGVAASGMALCTSLHYNRPSIRILKGKTMSTTTTASGLQYEDTVVGEGA